METIVINAYQIVGNSICVEADDGVKVYEKLKIFLTKKEPVTLSFQNVEILTTAFLNTAVGQLYKDFSEEEIKKLLSVKDMNPSDAELLKRVVAMAKLFYKDPERMNRSIQAILERE